MLRKFFNSSKGNFGVIFSLFLTPVIVLVGVSNDLSHAIRTEEKLQRVVDSAALAGVAAGGSELDAKRAANEYLHEHLEAAGIDPETVTGSSITVTTSSANSREVVITMESEVPTFFAGLVHVETIKVKAQAKAAHTKKTVEIAMVLDVSGSMYADNRINKMKVAATYLIDKMHWASNGGNDVSISIIPFAGSVQFGPGYQQYLKPGINRRTWNGCFEFYTGSSFFGEKEFLKGSYSAFRYYRSVRYPNWGCPEKNTPLMLLSKDFQKQKKLISNLVANGRSNTQYAMALGLKTLSPYSRGFFPGSLPGKPENYSDKVSKILIIMTYGRITGLGSSWREVLKVCDAIKSRNIQIYVIAFKATSYWMSTFVEDYRKCSGSSNHFYDAGGTGIIKILDKMSEVLKPRQLIN